MNDLNESILDSIKKLLGLSSDYTAFDTDIITHINTTFMILQQLGVGPDNGFSISDNTTKWNEFIDNENKFHAVKTYIYLKVRLIFDPPSSSTIVESYNRTISELEYRLRVNAETLL